MTHTGVKWLEDYCGAASCSALRDQCRRKDCSHSAGSPGHHSGPKTSVWGNWRSPPYPGPGSGHRHTAGRWILGCDHRIGGQHQEIRFVAKTSTFIHRHASLIARVSLNCTPDICASTALTGWNVGYAVISITLVQNIRQANVHDQHPQPAGLPAGGAAVLLEVHCAAKVWITSSAIPARPNCH